ncbi:unnamed protein product [Phytomonas sp. EM1]|nr:unnamed protein product [Phytomonas sp. EM1]|eukprot:CCW59767.1 unnamed protein product [Phytomonas sp. isolate EM1]
MNAPSPQLINLPQATYPYQPVQAVPSNLSQQLLCVNHPQLDIYPYQGEQMVPLNICMQGNLIYPPNLSPQFYNNHSRADVRAAYPDPYMKLPDQKAGQFAPPPIDDDRYQKQLIVNYLAPEATKDHLYNLFSRFGPLDGARVIYDRQTNLTRGYGFVYFRNPESASKAIEAMNGYELYGKRLRVGYTTNPINIISNDSISSYPSNSTH